MKNRHLLVMAAMTFAACKDPPKPPINPLTPPPPPKAVVEKLSAIAEKPTFTRDVAPIVFAKCAGCHHPGGSGPFPLLSYNDVYDHAEQIAEVTADRYMPPWPPAKGYARFLDNRSLTEAQIQTIQRWVEQGAKEGHPSDLPPVPVFKSGWKLGEPDLVLGMTEAYTLKASGPDEFRNFVLPATRIRRDRWVKAVEFRPGNASVVHHALVLIDENNQAASFDALDPEPGYAGMNGAATMPDGQWLAWVPGKYFMGDERFPWLLRRRTALVLQLHLQSTGKIETAQSAVGIYFTDQPPKKKPAVLAVESRRIDIPAGESNHVVRRTMPLFDTVEVVGVWPHAHYLAKSMRSWATQPDGHKVWLFNIPSYDFNWQDEYRYATPIKLPRGTQITIEYAYDNSEGNVQNPHHPPRRAFYGEDSTNEMAHAAFHVLMDDPARQRQMVARHYAEVSRRNIDDLKHMLRVNPQDARLSFDLGRAYSDVGRHQDAVRAFQVGVRIDPKHFAMRMELGTALTRLGRHEEAIRQYEGALESGAGAARMHNNIGAAKAAMRQFDAAKAAYTKAIELWSEYPEARYNLANVFSYLGEFDQAQAQLEKAVELDPEFAQAFNNLGILLARQGKLDEAALRFQQALRADPAHPSARKNLAMTGRLGLVTAPPAEGGIGMRVTAVRPNGPAQRAGLQPGDRIVQLDEQKISPDRLKHAVSEGGPFSLTVQRNAQRLRLRVEP